MCLRQGLVPAGQLGGDPASPGSEAARIARLSGENHLISTVRTTRYLAIASFYIDE